MRDTRQAADRGRLQRLSEPGNLADRAHPLQQGLLRLHRDAGGIITAVFQPPQTLEQHRYDIPVSGDTDNSTHIPTPWSALPAVSSRVGFAGVHD